MNPPKFGSLFLRGAYTDSDRTREEHVDRKEGILMKIVVLRTPALLAPLLRRVFGIRKEKKR